MYVGARLNYKWTSVESSSGRLATNNNSAQPQDNIVQRGHQCSEANPIGLVSYYQMYQKKPFRNQWLCCPYSLDSHLILRFAEVWDSELKSSTTLSFNSKQWIAYEDHTLLPSNRMSLQAKEQGKERRLPIIVLLIHWIVGPLTAILSISLSSARLPLLRISTSTLITYVADYLTALATRGFPRARLSMREFPSFIKYLDGDYNPLFHDPISGPSYQLVLHDEIQHYYLSRSFAGHNNQTVVSDDGIDRKLHTAAIRELLRSYQLIPFLHRPNWKDLYLHAFLEPLPKVRDELPNVCHAWRPNASVLSLCHQAENPLRQLIHKSKRKDQPSSVVASS